jgi:hypothetical protein
VTALSANALACVSNEAYTLVTNDGGGLMALSNAERQRRYIERLKARAAVGEKTITNIIPAANGGLLDRVIGKDSADCRRMGGHAAACCYVG